MGIEESTARGTRVLPFVTATLALPCLEVCILLLKLLGVLGELLFLAAVAVSEAPFHVAGHVQALKQILFFGAVSIWAVKVNGGLEKVLIVALRVHIHRWNELVLVFGAAKS